MAIKFDTDKRLITNSKGEVLPFTGENIRKISLQSRGVMLDDNMEWNKSINEIIEIIRVERDFKIVKDDYYFLSDTTKLLTTEGKNLVKASRQKLRDLTENITDIDDALNRLKTL